MALGAFRCGNPLGRIVACSSTRFPTRARLRKSLFSVAGFTSRWIGFVNTGRLIGTDLSRIVDARLVFMNGARYRIATLEEMNARNEVGVAPFLNAEDS